MREDREILRTILKQRNIVSDEDVSEYLSDRPQKTYNPFLLLNMEAGVDLLLSEIKSGTKICIYGDYDADGVTSICILSAVIGELTDNFMYYIPSRIEEGYGLNVNAIAFLHEQGVGLIVTVDCGSVSYEEVEYAKSVGMRIIVTDHHSIDDVKADCILINPKQKECLYPFKELAGCGVTFKLAQAVQQRAGLPKKVINSLLDFVAIGTVGDIVSLTDENRTLVKYGLNIINSRGREALKCLSQAISLKWITSENIAFGIAPHINAAGRMARADEAVKLFRAEDSYTISNQVSKLLSYNNERKKKQEEAYKACIDMITGEEDFIILDMEDMHEGIGGIVAGKIKENYKRPVIIVTPSGEKYFKGTGRSIPQIDIYELLKRHDHMFEKFGGHKSACGFLMKKERFCEFADAVSEDIAAMKVKNPGLFEDRVSYDLELYAEEVSVSLVKEIELMEPFGQGNSKPLFYIKNIIPADVRFMGSDETHVKFTVPAEGNPGFECVLFKRAQEKKELICSGKPICIIGSLELNIWRGRERIQFIVEEMK